MLEQPVEVKFLPEGVSACVLPGETLLVAAVKAGIRVDSACGGAGTCGKCLLQIVAGEYTTNEEVRLSIEQRRQQVVYACQTKVLSPMLVQVPDKSRITLKVPNQEVIGDKRYGLVVDYRRYTLTGGLIDLATGIQTIWDSMDNLAAARSLPDNEAEPKGLQAVKLLERKLCAALGIKPEHVLLKAIVGAPDEVSGYFDVALDPQAIVVDLLGGHDDTLVVDLSTDVKLWTIKGGLKAWVVQDTVLEGIGLKGCTRAGQGSIDWVQIGQANLEVAVATQGKHRPMGLSGAGLLSCLRQMLATGIITQSGQLNTLDHQRLVETEAGRQWVLAWGWQTAVGRAISISEAELELCFKSFADIREKVNEALAWQGRAGTKVLLQSNIGETLTVESVQAVGIMPKSVGLEVVNIGNPYIKKLTQLLVDKYK